MEAETRQRQADAAAERDALYRQQLAAEVARLRLTQDARAVLRREQTPADEPEFVMLPELLSELDGDPDHRVARLWPTGGRVVLAAQYKAGKTTMVGNLVRSLVDGIPFLGRYEVIRPSGTVVVIDAEMSRRMLRRWYADLAVEKAEMVTVVPLRGRLSAFDITDPAMRTGWARRLQDEDAAVLVLDPVGPLLAALGLDENSSTDVGRLLVALDTLLDAAGIREALVVHHMGHNGERSRGASRLRDWPDAEWRLVREKPEDPGEAPDPAAARYFAAYGRDVDEPEQQLAYDPGVRRLTIGGGSRAQARRELPTDDVVAVVTGSPGLSANSVEARLRQRGIPERKAKAARRLAVDLALVETRPGPNRGKLHYPVGAVGTSGDTVGTHPLVAVGATPIGRTTTTTTEDEPVGTSPPEATP
jgi:hypothetical protein